MCHGKPIAPGATFGANPGWRAVGNVYPAEVAPGASGVRHNRAMPQLLFDRPTRQLARVTIFGPKNGLQPPTSFEWMFDGTTARATCRLPSSHVPLGFKMPARHFLVERIVIDGPCKAGLFKARRNTSEHCITFHHAMLGEGEQAIFQLHAPTWCSAFEFIADVPAAASGFGGIELVAHAFPSTMKWLVNPAAPHAQDLSHIMGVFNDVRVYGPMPMGSAIITFANGNTAHYDVKRHIPSGDWHSFAIDSWRVGPIAKVEWQTACGISTEGELVFGPSPALPGMVRELAGAMKKAVHHQVDDEMALAIGGAELVAELRRRRVEDDFTKELRASGSQAIVGDADEQKLLQPIYAESHPYAASEFERRAKMAELFKRGMPLTPNGGDITLGNMPSEPKAKGYKFELELTPIRRPDDWAQERSRMADEMQTLKDDNTKLLATVGKLTLENESLNRKLKAKR